jgi:hypothetical protein
VGYAGAADGPSASGESKDKSEAAVKVFIDPVTGKVRQPTPADIENLMGATKARAVAKQSGQPEQLDMRYGAGGAVGVKLGATSLSYVVATKTPDGKLSVDCVTGDKAAAKAVSADK